MQGSLLIISSNTLYILIICALVSVIVLYIEVISRVKNYKLLERQQNGNAKRRRQRSGHVKKFAPGPRKLPIIGNLTSLHGYEVPYQAFNDLGEKYGDVISLQLGTVPALVVNGIDTIREVLIGKTAHFDSRPNFRRYHQLFSGNKENSLAFCDWSDLHKHRRDMLTPHTFPRNQSNNYNSLNEIIFKQVTGMIEEISSKDESEMNSVDIKEFLLNTSANIFTQYFCSREFSNDDEQFRKLIKNFDKIFYEVNQGYAADFLPFLLPLHKRNLMEMEKWSHEIRSFIMTRIIEDRIELTTEENENDFVDSFIMHIKENRLPTMEWDTALFALEDIIGGHSAVGNFLTKVFGYLVQNPQVQLKIQEEIDTVTERKSDDEAVTAAADDDDVNIDLNKRNQMPYTQAVIMEALRLIASPIVPHVSNQETTINGYDVDSDTLIFINNYELSMSPKLWESPEKFMPERFLKNDTLVKPDFFLPFGAGRRSCMGYKLVQFISFAILANIFKTYKVLPVPKENYKIQVGSLAVPENSFKIALERRN